MSPKSPTHCKANRAVKLTFGVHLVWSVTTMALAKLYRWLLLANVVALHASAMVILLLLFCRGRCRSLNCKARAGEGEPCSEESRCQQDLYCDADIDEEESGTCQARIPMGSPCMRNPNQGSILPDTCEFGSTCADSICRPVRFEGESCDVSEECSYGNSYQACENGICTQTCDSE